MHLVDSWEIVKSATFFRNSEISGISKGILGIIDQIKDK